MVVSASKSCYIVALTFMSLTLTVSHAMCLCMFVWPVP